MFDAQEGLCAEVGREGQKMHWISVEECDTASLPAQLKADHCIKPVHMRECYLKLEVWSQCASYLLNVALTGLFLSAVLLSMLFTLLKTQFRALL